MRSERYIGGKIPSTIPIPRGLRRLLAPRVYFVGSHSVGKTTLAKYVAHKYRLNLLTEVARLALAETERPFDELRVDLPAVCEYQREVFRRQIAAESAQRTGFVSDRAFDSLAYAAEHSSALREIVTDPSYFAEHYVRWVASGTVVFFVRPHRSLLREDGVRAGVDWDSVLRIDGMVKFMLELWGCPYVSIDTPNMSERVRLVNYTLDARIR